jgi:hypothetical protein
MMPSGAWFFRFAPPSGEYRVDTRPPTNDTPLPLETLLVEQLRRRLREMAAEIEERTKRLLAPESTAEPADQVSST